MKKFVIRRILPAMLALSVMVSIMVVPARAVDPVTIAKAIESVLGLLETAESIARMQKELSDYFKGLTTLTHGYGWCAADAGVAAWHVSEQTLYELKDMVNNASSSLSAEVVQHPQQSDWKVVRIMTAGEWNSRFICLADKDSGSPFVYQVGKDDAMSDDEKQEETSVRWIPASSVQIASGMYTPVPLSRLQELAAQNGGTVYPPVSQQADYYYIIRNGGRFFLADENMKPFVYQPNRVADKPEDRPTGSIWVVDENGNLVQVEGDDLPDNVGVDLGTLIGNLPTDSNVIFNGCTYDESTKTYYYHTEVPITIDNRQYYYFTYNYHINYTSVTYIGTTEEYDKHYEVYYKLPDGRSSADLTAEELEQLNLSIDVINYGRSADDVSLRSLYHFDGDTDDASYWNYCTEFTWNKGASLTYMDEGTFNGSLYLDETEHDFTFTMPSGLTGDFTLQFRYYQSATAAPQTDSYINLGSSAVLKLDGASIKDGSGATLSAMPIGSWNELALIRDSGTLYYYLNGVKIGSVSQGIAWDKLTFHFGSGQQTFKKLDELRVLNRALQKGGASYTPTSVPHDTNLTLVLPDSAKPVADEYWSVKFHEDAACSANFTNGGTLADIGSPTVNNMTASVFPSGLYIQPGSCHADFYNSVLEKGYYRSQISETPYLLCYLQDGGTYFQHQISIVFDDGTVFDSRFFVRSPYSGKFYVASSDAPEPSEYWKCPFPGGVLTVGLSNNSDGIFLYIVFDPSSTHNIVAIERYSEAVPYSATMVQDSLSALAARSTITAEHITSITAMTPEDLATPTLAVRSDIPVTSWQIGGVRPSVPSKGQVWALVERQYITSLQIYNGRAWEACDGRVWTGSRWVPYSAYNVITLKDMSDIVDSSSPDKEYIYTESGFWDWWQRSWNAFTTKFFALFGGDSGKDCKHSYTDEIVTEATCTDPGQMRRTCSKCGESVLEEIPALGHDWNATETVPDSYELPGGTKCPDCGGTEFSSTLEDDTFTCACGNEDCGKTWTVKGRRQYGQTTYTCSRCGETYVESNETGGGLWESLGNFLSDGVRWIGDKLTSLVESLSGLNKIFADMAEKVKEIAGGFPALFGSFLALMPQDLMAVIWFGIVGVIVLLVYKKWFG